MPFLLFHGWLKVGNLSAPLLNVLDTVCGVIPVALSSVWLGRYHNTRGQYRKSAGTGPRCDNVDSGNALAI